MSDDISTIMEYFVLFLNIDIRTNSPTFMQWIAHEVSADNHLSFYIPRGFAYGSASLEDNTVMQYRCDGKYDR